MTRRGKWVSVVLSAAEYERLKRLDQASAPSLGQLLLAMPQDDGAFERGIARKRAADPAAAVLWRSSPADGCGRGTALGPVIGLEHGLTVVTRNLKHFQPTGVATLNPWH